MNYQYKIKIHLVELDLLFHLNLFLENQFDFYF